MAKKYKVYDTTGVCIRIFDSYKEAYIFCMSRGRFNWSIKGIIP